MKIDKFLFYFWLVFIPIVISFILGFYSLLELTIIDIEFIIDEYLCYGFCFALVFFYLLHLVFFGIVALNKKAKEKDNV